MVSQPEKLPWLVFLPIVATLTFYAVPYSFQKQTIIQFLPQILAYCGLGVWATVNSHPCQRLGLTFHNLCSGVAWGSVVGLILGTVNTILILWAIPAAGWDIAFLKETPHAQVPALIMVPWGILLIAVGVEINFRGFVLGRCLALVNDGQKHSPSAQPWTRFIGSAIAVGTSSLVFAFDPFLESTFRHLHWIAVWDGVIWGWMWVRRRNLYAVITAHAVEVIILYLSVKTALT